MANARRVLRLQKLLLEILGETLQREIEDPQLDLASITRVKLTSDLMNATVYWSCLAKDKGRERAAEAMQRVLPILQSRVARELQIRVTPRLSLTFDPTLENAQRLESIFHHLKEERGEDAEDENAEDGAEDGAEAAEDGLGTAKDDAEAAEDVADDEDAPSIR